MRQRRHRVVRCLRRLKQHGYPFSHFPVLGKALAGAVVLLKVKVAETLATWFTLLMRCARALILGGWVNA